VNKLKAQQGGDMIAYGGGTLVSDLIAKGLLDELHLFVNPTAIGAGMPVFANLEANQQLHLVTAQPFDCGITAMHFEPKRSGRCDDRRTRVTTSAAAARSSHRYPASREISSLVAEACLGASPTKRQVRHGRANR
jgi:hypothetical protein